MKIRLAEERDISGLNRLLRQVANVHHEGRPDLFRGDSKKYTDEELSALLKDENRPIFVCIGEEGDLDGYAFCVLKQTSGDNILTDLRSLYLDDLCVEETKRGQHIGRALYEHVLQFAKAKGCYNVTLNVWSCNPGAMGFYRAMGMRPQKICMEQVLD